MDKKNVQKPTCAKHFWKVDAVYIINGPKGLKEGAEFH
jgi:hypothetical protein